MSASLVTKNYNCPRSITNLHSFLPSQHSSKPSALTIFDIKPQKSETHITRLTVGGNIIEYPCEVTTPTADITTYRTLINSVISIPDAILFCADIAKFYFNTPMDHYEYMKLPFYIIPQEIIDEYKLTEFARNGKFYIKL